MRTSSTSRSREKPDGVIVQFGGQTPLNLAVPLKKAGVNIIGTTPESIDVAEDREKFKALLKKLKLTQPENGIATSFAEAKEVAQVIGYPVVVRPSYVLGGRAMEIVYAEADLESFVEKAYEASPDLPILIDKFLEDAIEIDVDAVADGRAVRRRRYHGAHRGGGHPLGRQRVRPAALFAQRRPHRADQVEHAAACERA